MAQIAAAEKACSGWAGIGRAFRAVGSARPERNVFAQEDESVTEKLFREPQRKVTAVEGIDRRYLLPRFKQPGNLVSNAFNLSKRVFARFLNVHYEHKKEITLGSEPVLDVREVTNELTWVVAARRLGTWVGTQEQRQVKGCSVRAINDTYFLSKSEETAPAVSALARISLHRNTSLPGADNYSQSNRTKHKTRGIECSKNPTSGRLATD
jgi:hypothetical protein